MSVSITKSIWRAAGALFILTALISCSGNLSQVTLFEDEFEQLPAGFISSNSFSLNDYHYIPGAGQSGPWTVTSYGRHEGYSTAWEIVEKADGNMLRQNFINTSEQHDPLSRHIHPIIVAGDSVWHDYKLDFSFSPGHVLDKCGIVFKYQNSRNYYYYGMEGNTLVIKLIMEATSPRRPFEKVLISIPFNWEKGAVYKGEISIRENQVFTLLNDSLSMIIEDNQFARGKVGFLSDGPAEFYSMKVSTLNRELRKIIRYKKSIANERSMKISENPKPVLWKKIQTPGFGTGRNLRFGDLDGDGEMDILIGQVSHHGSSEECFELTCLTAMNLDGEILWQKGDPGSGNAMPTGDVAFQIHDLDGDGTREVIYTMNFRLYVVDGKTGRLKRSRMTPLSKPPADKYTRIHGNSLYFCDLQGKGRDSDILIKDKFWNIWAYNERLQLLWTKSCNTGHYPFAYDVDNDEKDELALAYSLIDDDGSTIWDKNKSHGDNSNAVLITRQLNPSDSGIQILYASGDWGNMVLDREGEVNVHNPVGHVKHLSLANFRSDLPGLEYVSTNFWGSQGIINFHDSRGNIYHTMDGAPYGSLCLPVCWKGDGEEYFILNTSAGNGGLINGFGKKVAVFPDDGHPVLCHAVLDITGDSRDEILSWNENEIWIYTQNDSPRSAKIWTPERNPLYNQSNFQVNYSYPEQRE